MLLGRRAECESLERLLADALAARSRLVVLRGEPGVGKSALLEYLEERVTGWYAATAVGVGSELGHRNASDRRAVEGAARSGDECLAETALERLAETTQASGTDWALGVEARSRALVTADDEAEEHFSEAIELLGGTRLRPDLARTRLLYGEWLRRVGRRVGARRQLRTAHDLLVAMGMEAFAERARRELLATGEKARKRSDETRGQLTPQEEQVARLARDGLSNPEVGARLCLSPRTVEWHLRKVFAKLGIASRGDLRAALPRGELEGALAYRLESPPGRHPGLGLARGHEARRAKRKERRCPSR